MVLYNCALVIILVFNQIFTDQVRILLILNISAFSSLTTISFIALKQSSFAKCSWIFKVPTPMFSILIFVSSLSRSFLWINAIHFYCDFIPVSQFSQYNIFLLNIAATSLLQIYSLHGIAHVFPLKSVFLLHGIAFMMSMLFSPQSLIIDLLHFMI